MVETILSTIGQNISELLSDALNYNKEENPSLESGVFLFFSFDLADSTAFKTEHPSLWANVFTNFYGQVLQRLGVENYKSPDSEYDDSTCVRKLWKLIGDEVLIYVQIRDLSQLYAQVTSVNTTITELMEKVAEKVEKEIKDQKCQGICTKHCQDIKDVIMETLGIKTTMWIAECYQTESKPVSNIVYQPLTSTPNLGRIDFLGREVDEGFRMAKYAVKNRVIVSPLLAWLIWKEAQDDEDKKKIVKANFKITAFVTMKGVWRNRKVPIIMFHQKFEEFEELLAYDELDLETYSNVKEVGFACFKTDKRFDIERIDSILNNVYRKKEAEKLCEKLKNSQDIEMPSKNIEMKRELHIACIIFCKSNRVLIHRDEERGLEFGCIKKIFEVGLETWKKVCEEGYKEKYDLEIEVDKNPIPVATYHYEQGNVFGLIVIAKYIGGEDKIATKKGWMICSEEEVKETMEKTVDNFSQNLNRAIQLKDMWEIGV